LLIFIIISGNNIANTYNLNACNEAPIELTKPNLKTIKPLSMA